MTTGRINQVCNLNRQADPARDDTHRSRPAGQGDATKERSQREALENELPARHSKPRRWRKTSETNELTRRLTAARLSHLPLSCMCSLNTHPSNSIVLAPNGYQQSCKQARLNTQCMLKQVVSTEPASNSHWCSASRSLHRLSCQPLFTGSRPPNPTTYLPKAAECLPRGTHQVAICWTLVPYIFKRPPSHSHLGDGVCTLICEIAYLILLFFPCMFVCLFACLVVDVFGCSSSSLFLFRGVFLCCWFGSLWVGWSSWLFVCLFVCLFAC